MAIKIPGAGQKGFDDDDLGGEAPIIADINVTPLVDIFLLLLVIFMVTSTVISPMNIPVQLPQSTQAANASKQSPGVIVTVNAAEQIYVNGTRTSEDNLSVALKAALALSVDKTIIVEGDRKAVLGTIVKVMDEGKRAGALKFAFATKTE